MKLLFDENLSPKLPRLISEFFPGGPHVRDCNLTGMPDYAVWEYARANGFIVVSKDGDFYQRSLLLGARRNWFGSASAIARGNNF